MSEELQSEAAGTGLAVQESRGGELVAGTGINAGMLAQVDDCIRGNIDPSELVYSRISIVQPLTPEVSNRVPGYEPGQLIDNQTREILTRKDRPRWLKGKVDDKTYEDLPKETFGIIVPVFKLPSEFIEWIPRKEQTGTEKWKFKTTDKNDPRVRAGLWKPIGHWTGEGAPPVTHNINLLTIVLDPVDYSPLTSFIVATFNRTSFSCGKKLVTACNQHALSNIPFWGRTYYLSTHMEKYDENVAYVLNMAKGELLSAVNPTIGAQIGQFAAYLSHPTEGKSRQEMLINAAVIDSDHTTEGSESGGDFSGSADVF